LPHEGNAPDPGLALCVCRQWTWGPVIVLIERVLERDVQPFGRSFRVEAVCGQDPVRGTQRDGEDVLADGAVGQGGIVVVVDADGRQVRHVVRRAE